MSELLVGLETAKVVQNFAVKAKYYQAYMCSCVNENSGVPDPNDDCYEGWRYYSPVEYMLMRTAVNFRHLQEKDATILQGGCTLTIPKQQEAHHAAVTGSVDLSSGIDLSTLKNINISIDGGAAVQIDCSSGAVSTEDVKLYEIVEAINAAGLGLIAYESDISGDPDGSGYLTLRSLRTGNDSSLTILKPSSADATGILMGINQTSLPARHIPKYGVYAYLPVHQTIGRMDVVTIQGRTRRDGDLLKRGVRDDIKTFDIQRILNVAAKGTKYVESVDYTVSGNTIVWLDGHGPTTGTPYTVEFTTLANYVLYKEMPTDRGGDGDYVSKRVLMALRQYIQTGSEQALPIDSL